MLSVAHTKVFSASTSRSKSSVNFVKFSNASSVVWASGDVSSMLSTDVHRSHFGTLLTSHCEIRTVAATIATTDIPQPSANPFVDLISGPTPPPSVILWSASESTTMDVTESFCCWMKSRTRRSMAFSMADIWLALIPFDDELPWVHGSFSSHGSALDFSIPCCIDVICLIVLFEATTVCTTLVFSSLVGSSDITMSPCSIVKIQWVGEEFAWADQKIPEWSRDCVSGCPGLADQPHCLKTLLKFGVRSCEVTIIWYNLTRIYERSHVENASVQLVSEINIWKPIQSLRTWPGTGVNLRRSSHCTPSHRESSMSHQVIRAAKRRWDSKYLSPSSLSCKVAAA